MSRAKYGFGAIGTGLLALAAILFSNIQTTKDMLTSAQGAGGAPKMLADLILNPAFQVILVIVAVIMGARAVVVERAADATRSKQVDQGSAEGTTAGKPHFKEIVSDRDFLNETVELDGKLFKGCRFKNVTFVYNGEEATGFMEQRFSGMMKITTKNKAAETYARFLIGFTKMDGFASWQRLTQGPDGRWVTTGPSEEDIDGVRYVMSELSLRYMTLMIYGQHTSLFPQTDSSLTETESKVQLIRQDLVDLAEQHLMLDDLKVFREAPAANDKADRVTQLLNAIDDLMVKVRRTFMRVSTAERKIQRDLRV